MHINSRVQNDKSYSLWDCLDIIPVALAPHPDQAEVPVVLRTSNSETEVLCYQHIFCCSEWEGSYPTYEHDNLITEATKQWLKSTANTVKETTTTNHIAIREENHYVLNGNSVNPGVSTLGDGYNGVHGNEYPGDGTVCLSCLFTKLRRNIP